MHWAHKYIGKPWAPGAKGPDKFDCWGLLCDIYEKQLGITLPLHSELDKTDRKSVIRYVDAQANTVSDWHRIDTPVHECAVAMGASNKYSHVGIYLDVDGGLVLHSAEKSGVVAQSIATLRANGMSNLLFFKYGPNS